MSKLSGVIKEKALKDQLLLEDDIRQRKEDELAYSSGPTEKMPSIDSNKVSVASVRTGTRNGKRPSVGSPKHTSQGPRSHVHKVSN